MDVYTQGKKIKVRRCCAPKTHLKIE